MKSHRLENMREEQGMFPTHIAALHMIIHQGLDWRLWLHCSREALSAFLLKAHDEHQEELM